jgi:TIR domain/Protein of unknown function (DUF4019)
MNIFLSYASEDRRVAEEIHLALIGAGHRVFFDGESLPPGGDFISRIECAVRESDAVVFLISRHSVAKGSFALTELQYARGKWAHPKGKILPIKIDDIDFEQIPAYLKAVTVLEPRGNIAAETILAIDLLAPREAYLRKIGRAPAFHGWRITTALVICSIIFLLGISSHYPQFGNFLRDKVGPLYKVREDVQPARERAEVNSGLEQPKAGEEAAARADAEKFLKSLHNADWETLWEKQTSAYFKSKVKKDDFLSGLATGKQYAGPVLEYHFVKSDYFTKDAESKLSGQFFNVTYLETYKTGKLYLKLVVARDFDGSYRMIGFWPAKAPN